MFVAFTNADILATNFGMCATFKEQKIGMPVTFVRCNPISIRQSTWNVILLDPANPASVRQFCINSEENLCIGINTATGVAQLVNGNSADPAQQFIPLTPDKKSRYTNRLWGSNFCATVRGGLLIMKKCDPTAPHQQLFTYGPLSRMSVGSDLNADLDGEYQYQQPLYQPTGNQFSHFPYPYNVFFY